MSVGVKGRLEQKDCRVASDMRDTSAPVSTSIVRECPSTRTEHLMGATREERRRTRNKCSSSREPLLESTVTVWAEREPFRKWFSPLPGEDEVFDQQAGAMCPDLPHL